MKSVENILKTWGLTLKHKIYHFYVREGLALHEQNYSCFKNIYSSLKVTTFTTKYKVSSLFLLLIFHLIFSANVHAPESSDKYRDKPLTVNSFRFSSSSVVGLFSTAFSALVSQQIISSSLFLNSITCLLSPFSLKKCIILKYWEKLSS